MKITITQDGPATTITVDDGQEQIAITITGSGQQTAKVTTMPTVTAMPRAKAGTANYGAEIARRQASADM